MQIDKISVLDLYFLCRLVADPVGRFEALLDAELKPLLGPGWRAQFTTLSAQYRDATEKLIKEEAEARSANAELVAFKARFTTWRRYLEAVARRLQKKDATRGAALLKAVGYGAGSPDDSKSTKDFLLLIGGTVLANGQLLQSLGATPEAIAFARVVQEQEETASGRASTEQGDAAAARKAMRVEYRRLKEVLEQILDGSVAARAAAAFGQNEAVINQAEELLSRLEAAVGQARVQSRKRADTEVLPEEVTLPVPDEPAPEAPVPPPAS